MTYLRLRDAGGLPAELDTTNPSPDGPALDCFRCGICCERWQPLLTGADAARLAEALEMSLPAFFQAYTAPYPFSDEERLLNRGADGGCVFLRWQEQGGLRRAACAVHAARPAVCRDWAAGLDKKECLQGLARFASPEGEVSLSVLYG